MQGAGDIPDIPLLLLVAGLGFCTPSWTDQRQLGLLRFRGSGVWCFGGLGLTGEVQGFRHLPAENGFKARENFGVWGFGQVLAPEVGHKSRNLQFHSQARAMLSYSGALIHGNTDALAIGTSGQRLLWT